MLSGACVDPAGRFDEFIDKTTGGGGVDADLTDAPPLTEIPDISGTFLISIKIFFIPGNLRPIQALATTTMRPQQDGTARLDLSLQLLTFDQNLSDSDDRMPSGSPLVINDVPISLSGELTIMQSPLVISVPVNPLGRSATAENVMLIGSVKSEDLFCGTARGTITEPPGTGNLEDGEGAGAPTTWAAVRVADPNNLPTTDVFACP